MFPDTFRLTREAYLSDPCGSSSLPYWKTETFSIPKHLTIVRDGLYAPDRFPGTDEPYFRMIHYLQDLRAPRLVQGYERVRPTPAECAEHIRDCYRDERVTADELAAYTERPVFDPGLWVALRSTGDKRIAASGIGEFDRRIGEGTLEWIQVSPEHRHNGFGRFIVSELLRRLKGKAAFVTVSGKLLNPDHPQALYEACGFTGTVIWHVITSGRDDEQARAVTPPV